MVALAVTTGALPSVMQRVHRVIDYLGTVLVALAATSLVLLTSLGGTTYAWGSLPIVLLGVAGVILIVAFVFAERSASEPVIPLRLFSSRVFCGMSRCGKDGARHCWPSLRRYRSPSAGNDSVGLGRPRHPVNAHNSQDSCILWKDHSKMCCLSWKNS